MKKRVTLLLLCCTLLLSGCIKPDGGDVDTHADRPVLGDLSTHYFENVEYHYSTEVDEQMLLTGLDSAYLLLANKEYVLGEDYVPAKTVTLKREFTVGKDIDLEARTAEALYEMMDEMRGAGVTDVKVTSGYRTYFYQKSLFQQYLNVEMSKISEDARKCFSEGYLKEKYTDRGIFALDYADARTVVLSYSAYPGTSEHQTGLCIDFITSTMNGLTTAFENTEAFAWLCENAHQFGFILRYPEGKESITGYTYEPWHYRFVGREAATDIYFGKLTLEEYLGAELD
jgi:D-alanyl-D-alanine carboxypeptidase